MRGTMKSRFPMGFFIIITISCANCNFIFTSSDLNVVEKLREKFSSQHLIFVENREDVKSARRMKSFGPETYFAVISSSTLVKILENRFTQIDFFQRRTTVVTKEDLNLTSLLSIVCSPHFLTWIIFKDHTLQRGLHIPMNSNVFFVHSTPSTEVSVKRVYHLKDGFSEVVETVDWRNYSPDFNGTNFRGITLTLLFLTSKESCRNMHKKTLQRKLECIHWKLIELMGQKLNFSIKPVELKEKKYPYAFPNGSDSELFLRLKNKEVDFSALGHIISTRGRRFYMDFVWPTFVFKTMMYLKQGKLMGRWNSYLKPLETSVWLVILVWIILFGILFHTFEKLLLNKLKFNMSFMLDLIVSIMKALQVFCNQALPTLSAFYSVRIIHVLELFVVLVFFQAYCGYLVSSLTVVASRFPFLDLKGFFANDEYQIMTLSSGFHQYYFRKIIGSGQRENFMIPREELPDTIQQAVDKLCLEEHLAFADFREDLLDFEKLSCEISELPTPVLRLFAGIALPTSAPHKEYLRRELLTLRSSGIIRRYASALSSQTDFRDKRSANEFTSVAMSQIFSIFILLGFGILFSLVIFAFEVMTKSVGRRFVTPLRKRKKK